MTRGERLSLLIVATPAVVGSVFLMQVANASRASMVLQLAVFGAGAIAVLLTSSWKPSLVTDQLQRWICVVLVASLFLPLGLNTGSGPHRWVSLGGVRLYVASMALPVTLLLLGRSARKSPSGAAFSAVAAIAASLALLLQPDAAQAGALACALIPILLAARLSRAVQAVVFACTSGCVFVLWQRSDPLTPVAHVEGVFALAAHSSGPALTAALCAATLPVAALLRHSWRERSVGLLAAGVYYAVVLMHAPLLVTPVPLLGFGAGPILGYILVVLLAAA